mmetsp:Transcript_107543/g.272943  ORF Transcript_107543/g.272943 Transcript_107543/m.272943 type:complete len:219 (-) Transcript_107543:371-1027(-)
MLERASEPLWSRACFSGSFHRAPRVEGPVQVPLLVPGRRSQGSVGHRGGDSVGGLGRRGSRRRLDLPFRAGSAAGDGLLARPQHRALPRHRVAGLHPGSCGGAGRAGRLGPANEAVLRVPQVFLAVAMRSGVAGDIWVPALPGLALPPALRLQDRGAVPKGALQWEVHLQRRVGFRSHHDGGGRVSWHTLASIVDGARVRSGRRRVCPGTHGKLLGPG